jgi:hypothetical protein
MFSGSSCARKADKLTGSHLEYPHLSIEPERSRAAGLAPAITFALFLIAMASSRNSEDAWGDRRGFELIWCVSLAWIAARITHWLQRLCSQQSDGVMELVALPAWFGLVLEAMFLSDWAAHKPIPSAVIYCLGGAMAVDLLRMAYCQLRRIIPALKPGMYPSRRIETPGMAMGVFGIALLGLLAFTVRGEQKAGEWSHCLWQRSQIATLQYWYFEKHQKMVLGGKSAVELLYIDASEKFDDKLKCAQGGSYAFVKLANGSVAIECSCPDHGDVEDGTLSLANGVPTITIR